MKGGSPFFNLDLEIVDGLLKGRQLCCLRAEQTIGEMTDNVARHTGGKILEGNDDATVLGSSVWLSARQQRLSRPLCNPRSSQTPNRMFLAHQP